MTACKVQIRVSEADFDVGAELSALYARAGGDLGAVATFVGLVRDLTDGEAETILHLEHYPGMTEKSLQAIVDQAIERWPLLDVLVIHRVGPLAGRSQIVYVQTASSHRDAAFASAEFIMDYLKTDAVFWKRESSPDGERWVESTSADQERRSAWSGQTAPDNAERRE